MTFTIGADPEVFVGDNDKFVSAHNLVTGTKLHPTRVVEGAIQVDGMALEYNIDPCTSKEDFVRRIIGVKKQLLSHIGGLKVLPKATVTFTEEDIADVPTQNFELGCSVDFNAYTLRPNETPESSAMFRTAGGHVHVGGFPTKKRYSSAHLAECARLARLMDRELGVPSLTWDKDVLRRSMYGKAGAFRPTFYGMEYRSLSNLWVFDEALISFVYDATERAFEMFMEGEDVTTDKWRKIIDESNFEEAEYAV